jgi:hypothetical protein
MSVQSSKSDSFEFFFINLLIEYLLLKYYIYRVIVLSSDTSREPTPITVENPSPPVVVDAMMADVAVLECKPDGVAILAHEKDEDPRLTIKKEEGDKESRWSNQMGDGGDDVDNKENQAIARP